MMQENQPIDPNEGSQTIRTDASGAVRRDYGVAGRGGGGVNQ